jgi:membrane protease YdiL (CAAX protease family)
VVTIMVIGALATGVGWYLVARRGVSVWVVFAALGVMLGGASLITRTVPVSPRVGTGVAAVVGLAVGIGLYLGTVAFVMVVHRWPSFASHVAALYGRGAGMSLPVALALAVVLAAPGEELFWRGLFQHHLTGPWGRAPAAAVSWALYVGANAVSASLPITAAAVVGGAVWTVLAGWTGGVLASVLCHVLWIGLMLVAPPPGGARPSSASVVAGPAAIIAGG